MRIDKYLWCVRFYKSRSLSTDAGKKNRFMVNDEVIKPSKEVMIGDVIKVKKQGIIYQLKVLQFPKNRVGAKIKSLYVKDITPEEELERLRQIKDSQGYYRYKGVGRPTKKDRRELDDFTQDFEN